MEQTELIAEESARDRWTRIIEEHRSSGLALSVFCRQRSLAVSSYYGWRRKLREEPAKAGFIEARVVGDCDGGEARRGGVEPGAEGVRIELAGGRRVLVSRGFDRRLLLEVIGVLEQTAGVTGGVL